MNQSSVIGAALIVAYVIFVITKGELPCYLAVLGISTPSGCPQNLQPPGCGGSSTTTTTGGGGTGIGININPILGGGGGGGGIGLGGGIGIGVGGIGIGLGIPGIGL